MRPEDRRQFGPVHREGPGAEASRREVALSSDQSLEQVLERFNVSRATAYRWLAAERAQRERAAA